LSYPDVLIDPGVFRIASEVHWKSATVIGVPSSHTALGLMSIVTVIAAPPEDAAVVSAPPAVVSGAEVSAVVPPVVSAVVPPVVPAVVALVLFESLPQDAAMNAIPTARAA
jgi:hypothetical protein